MYDLWNENGKCPPEQMAQVQMNLTVCADLNQDTFVNLADLSQFCTHWLATECDGFETCGAADITEDGNVNLEDFREFAEYWPWP